MAKCIVCNERPKAGVLFCARCNRAYDRHLAKDNTVAAVIEWTAKRARRFEAKRRRAQVDAVRYR